MASLTLCRKFGSKIRRKYFERMSSGCRCIVFYRYQYISIVQGFIYLNERIPGAGYGLHRILNEVGKQPVDMCFIRIDHHGSFTGCQSSSTSSSSECN